MLNDFLKAQVDRINMARQSLALHEAYQATFSTADGQKVLDHIMKEGFMLKPTFVAGDPQLSALNEGSRRLALSILRHYYRDHGKLTEHVRNLIDESINENPLESRG